MCLVHRGDVSLELRKPCGPSNGTMKALDALRPTVLKQLVESSAAAYLSRDPLGPSEQALLRQLYPRLASLTLRVTCEAPALAACPADPQDFALLPPREAPGNAGPTTTDGACVVAVPMVAGGQRDRPGGCCTFTFAAPPSAPVAAELRAFAAQLQSSLAHQSKLIMEDVWEDLVSSLPRDVAISLLQDACHGKPVLQDSLTRAAIRRTASAPPPAPEEAEEEDEWALEVDSLLKAGRCHST